MLTKNECIFLINKTYQKVNKTINDRKTSFSQVKAFLCLAKTSFSQHDVDIIKKYHCVDNPDSRLKLPADITKKLNFLLLRELNAATEFEQCSDNELKAYYDFLKNSFNNSEQYQCFIVLKDLYSKMQNQPINGIALLTLVLWLHSDNYYLPLRYMTTTLSLREDIINDLISKARNHTILLEELTLLQTKSKEELYQAQIRPECYRDEESLADLKTERKSMEMRDAKSRHDRDTVFGEGTGISAMNPSSFFSAAMTDIISRTEREAGEENDTIGTAPTTTTSSLLPPQDTAACDSSQTNWDNESTVPQFTLNTIDPELRRAKKSIAARINKLKKHLTLEQYKELLNKKRAINKSDDAKKMIAELDSSLEIFSSLEMNASGESSLQLKR